ncbi:MAG TPA: invasion associated locus B family protein [Gammaproteobacteria bacterium]|nr:invasion associated locus B family protein [Gammaproteobacteria bacterium]
MSMTRKLVLGTAMLFGASTFQTSIAGPAAQEPAKPTTPPTPETKMFDDWGYRCDKQEGAETEVCRIQQTATLNPQGQRLMQTEVRHVPGNPNPVAIFTVPLGILLPAGVELSVPGVDPVRIIVQRCDMNGCVAVFALEPRYLDAMKKAESGQVSFQDVQQRPVKVPLSLKGFGNALAALDEAKKKAEKQAADAAAKKGDKKK